MEVSRPQFACGCSRRILYALDPTLPICTVLRMLHLRSAYSPLSPEPSQDKERLDLTVRPAGWYDVSIIYHQGTLRSPQVAPYAIPLYAATRIAGFMTPSTRHTGIRTILFCCPSFPVTHHSVPGGGGVEKEVWRMRCGHLGSGASVRPPGG